MKPSTRIASDAREEASPRKAGHPFLYGFDLPPIALAMVAERMERLSSRASAIATMTGRWEVTKYQEQTESPIELALLFAMLVALDVHHDEFSDSFILDRTDDPLPALLLKAERAERWKRRHGGCRRWGVGILPQAKVGPWRVDFVLLAYDACDPDAKGHFFVVECDGHDFHERTKEQAARDKKRDRALQAAGLAVLRFTGSEIFADALGCAVQVREFIEAKFPPEEGDEDDTADDA